MNQIIFLIALGSIALIIQSSVFFHVLPSEWRPDLTLIILAWLSTNTHFLIGLFFSFFLGLGLDLMSGAQSGLFALLYLMLYIFFGYLDSYFEVTGVARNYVSIFYASCIIFSTLFVSRALAGDIDLSLHNLYWVLVKSLSTATFSWPTLKALNIIWDEYSKVTGAI